MTEPRDLIVQRVIQSLDAARDPESLVWQYFDADRDAVVEATRQTLEATREDTDPAKIAEVLDRELIEALRFPAEAPGGLLARLYVRRGLVAGVGLLLALAAAVAALLL